MACAEGAMEPGAPHSPGTGADRGHGRFRAIDGDRRWPAIVFWRVGDYLFPGSPVRDSNSVCPFGHFGMVCPSVTWTFAPHLAQWKSPVFCAFSPALAAMSVPSATGRLRPAPALK